MKIVIALGGNALLQNNERQTYSNLIKNIKNTCKNIISLIKNNKVVLSFGNGPEIGMLLLQNEIARKKVPAMPLDVLGAESQALIGYLFEEQLRNSLRENKINLPVANIITQVLVDKNDKAFKKPTKQILEIEVIKKLVNNKVIVIAAGGGGIPVYYKNSKLHGVEAVIDKDYASQLLANSIKAGLLLILTGTPYIYLNFMKKNQKALYKLTTKKAQELINQGEFQDGNVKPKLQATVNFVKNGGKKAIITSPENAVKALNNKAGTLIIK